MPEVSRPRERSKDCNWKSNPPEGNIEMSITVELTYDMSKALGTERFDVDEAQTVADVVSIARARFEGRQESFDKLARVTAVAINGVLVNYRKGLKTPVSDGDIVTFVKAAAGG
jgi:molybdopterin converting factor small subunit